MRLDYHTLDVFTDRVFGGNPLAVVPDADGLRTETMQQIARELNLSETVFLGTPSETGATRRARIFTPGAEVPFAGHPTLGAAFFLVASGAVAASDDGVEIVLEEGVGPVRVDVRCRGGRPVWARLVAAVRPTEERADFSQTELSRMIGVGANDLGADLPGVPGRLEPAFASAGLPFLIVPVADVAVAARARLDPATWERLLPEGAPSRLVYVVAPGPESGPDLRVRMFGPSVGVPEDPATGSAAAALGGYLGSRAGEGDHRWTLEQGIEMGRPSHLEVEVSVRVGHVTSVAVGGSAVLVAGATMDLGDVTS